MKMLNQILIVYIIKDAEVCLSLKLKVEELGLKNGGKSR